MAYFPNNTVSNFRVKLAETIDLPGQWEVALVGLHHPHTWPTIKKRVQQTFLYKLGADLKYETAILKDVYYPSLAQLIKALNASMSKEAQAKIKFSYNPSSRKVTVDVKRSATLWFTGDVAAVLGFAQDCSIEKKTSSHYTADINGGFSSLYVYTDIVDPQFVGDVKVPLLSFVNIQNDYGTNVHTSFCNLQYVPVKVNFFETIEMNIKNDRNENVSLKSGKSIATLHFRMRRAHHPAIVFIISK